ncbi:hypothetical protein D3C87_1233110 [compost metagenome]
MGVAAAQPREAREHHAAQPLAQRPGGAERQRRQHAVAPALGQPVPGAAGQRGPDRQIAGKQHHGQRGHPGRHLAVDMHADIEPPDPGQEPAQPERVARGGRRARARGIGQQRDQPGHRQDLEPPPVMGRERLRVGDAERCRHQQPEHSGSGPGAAAGLPGARRAGGAGLDFARHASATARWSVASRRTCSRCTCRASARSTSKRSGGKVMISPRWGTCPR